MDHEFIKDGDSDVFDAICDGHGQVVLFYCRVCKEGEGSLAENCPGAPKTEGQKQTEAALDKAPAARKKLSKIAPGTIAAILGVSPSMKREQVVRDMVRAYQGAESEYKANVAAEYADECRTTAERVFEDKFKLNIWRNDPKKPHKLIGGHQLTIKSAKRDGMGLLYLRMPYGQRDAATPNDFKKIDDQPHHFAQMQFEMLAAGVTWGVFAQWAVVAQRYDVVELDQGFIDDNLPQLEAFYASLKEECKNKLHLEPLRKSIDNDKARKIIAEFDELSVAITNANARKAELMGELKKMSGESSSIICGRLMTRTDSPGSISYAAAVKKLLPGADLEAYRGEPSTKWTLT